MMKLLKIENTWDIFAKNGEAIEDDFELITKDRNHKPIPTTVNVIDSKNVFIEEGAKLEFATLKCQYRTNLYW